MTAISDNLFDIECGGSHNLYSKIRDTWIPLQILSGDGKHDNVIRVPVSHNLLVKKAKTLPLNLPLDLTVEMIKFLI